jgi:hypothetical protein
MLESPRTGDRPGLRKKFDGKTYVLFKVELLKKNAEKIASELRGRSYYARISKSNNSYMIWFRD